MTSSTETTVDDSAVGVLQGLGRLASVSLDCSDPSAPADVCGALAPDAWRVPLDPAGHPSCLTTVTPD